MHFTIRGIPKAVDRALRERAAREKRSLNEVALEVIAHGLGLNATARQTA